MIHDPHHVAHIAAVIISANGQTEHHHIKAAVAAARGVLDEAHRRADEDEAAVEAARAAPEVPQSVEKIEGAAAKTE